MGAFKKVFCLLNAMQRKSAAVLLTLMLIGMILETLGVGLVVPALSLMMEPNLVEKYPFIAPYLDSLGNPDQTQLVIGSMLMLVIVYIFKTIFLVYLSWKQASFTYDLHKSLSQQLFEGYLRQPYTFHLQRNTAQLIRNATSEVGSYTNAILAVTSIVTEALVLIGIAILLIAVQPVGALLVLSVLGVSSYAFHYLTKERILNWGVARQHHEGLRIQHLQQGLGSVKDIKVLGREEGFFSQYAIHNEGSANMGRNNNMLQSLPRLWLELLAILGLATLVLTMLFQNKPIEALVPMLGLFAAAAFRLMSVTRMLCWSMHIKLCESRVRIMPISQCFNQLRRCVHRCT